MRAAINKQSNPNVFECVGLLVERCAGGGGDGGGDWVGVCVCACARWLFRGRVVSAGVKL